MINNNNNQRIPCGPVAKTPCFQCTELGSIPGEGTRFHMLQLRLSMPQRRSKILCAITKT